MEEGEKKKKVGLRTGKVARWSLEKTDVFVWSRAIEGCPPPNIKEYIPSLRSPLFFFFSS